MIEVFYVMAFVAVVMTAMLSLARWQHRNDPKKKSSTYEIDSSASQGERIAEKQAPTHARSK